MRSTIIPAQITTVEDKIAGNLNLTQIILLMIPVIWTTIVYILFLPQMKVSWYKLPIILIVLFASLILALRIKGEVVLQWLLMILKFNMRPAYYVFNKNDVYLRRFDVPIFEEKKKNFFTKVAKVRAKVIVPDFGTPDLVKLEHLITNPNISFSLKSKKKGGFHVAFEQVKK